MHKRFNLAGRRFGKLVALRTGRFRKGHRLAWICQCDCGNMHKATPSGLVNGSIESCGCTKRTQDGWAGSPTYNSYRSMLGRCYDENHVRYDDYGGRGITVCDRWRDPQQGFFNFLKDMGERPEGKTLDRIKVNGNYTKRNCKWSTPSEQRINQRPRHRRRAA